MCILPLPPPQSNVGVHTRLVHPQCTIIANIDLGERGVRSKLPNVPTVLYKIEVFYHFTEGHVPSYIKQTVRS